MKKLQIALDLLSIQEAKEILKKTAPYVDIIELGTPLMVSAGKRAVEEIKAAYPDKLVFADIKIMDGGKIMSDIVFKAGADMVSVLGAANDSTIQDVIENANQQGKKVLVDMCGIQNIEARGAVINEWQPEYICVHVGYDVQNTGIDPVEEVKKLAGISCKKAAAGGINLQTFEAACQADIDNIIVGGGLYKSEDVEATARKMREILDKYR